ncbi:MAG: pitrilysin family protein [Thermaerobacter sp.]|nr:pitrilysin family protein [Thermaerobacter sp.]
MAFEQTRLSDGAELFFWPTNKFKTTTVRVLLRQPLSAGAGQGALLPMVVRRGTRNLPEPIALSRALDALYGADLRGDVIKLGEEQVLIFHVEAANATYLDGEDPLRGAVDLLGDVLFDPRIEDGGFNPSWVAQEKENLLRRIQGIYSDKAHYAQLRLIETMCAGEDYAIPRLGRPEEIESITPHSLYARWQEILRTAPIAVYIVGDLQQDRAQEEAERLLDRLSRRDPKAPGSASKHVVPPEPRHVTDHQPVSQGKLAFGFTTDRRADAPNYPALVMMNGIYGSFSHSKLFQEVRERHSLAYYAYSQIDGLKGLMFVQSGIEFQNRGQAEEIILGQLEAMRRGDFREQEMRDTLAGIESQILQSVDAPSEAIMTDFELRAAARPTDPEARIAALREVDAAAIVQAAKAVSLDTVYFLDGQEGS